MKDIREYRPLYLNFLKWAAKLEGSYTKADSGHQTGMTKKVKTSPQFSQVLGLTRTWLKMRSRGAVLRRWKTLSSPIYTYLSFKFSFYFFAHLSLSLSRTFFFIFLDLYPGAGTGGVNCCWRQDKSRRQSRGGRGWGEWEGGTGCTHARQSLHRRRNHRYMCASMRATSPFPLTSSTPLQTEYDWLFSFHGILYWYACVCLCIGRRPEKERKNTFTGSLSHSSSLFPSLSPFMIALSLHGHSLCLSLPPLTPFPT